jgi:hypothetical protein
MSKVTLKDIGEVIENLSIGVGRGVTNQLEGLYQMAAHPVATAKGLYGIGQQAVTDPRAFGGMVGNALLDTAQRATSGPIGFGEVVGENLSPGMFRRAPNRQELITYHGSPHRINNVDADNPMGKFDLSKVGTGEGAQAYGHGIYLAESPDVARSYASDGGHSLLKARMLRDKAKKLRESATSDDLALAERLESQADGMGNGSNFYTVDLPDEHIAKMLDWDAPLSEQPEAVRKALKNYAAADDASITGGEFYRRLTQEFGAGQDEVSAALLKDGVPGIRYLDGNSRTTSFGPQSSGTRNFVIFDGDTAKILKRE